MTQDQKKIIDLLFSENKDSVLLALETLLLGCFELPQDVVLLLYFIAEDYLRCPLYTLLSKENQMKINRLAMQKPFRKCGQNGRWIYVLENIEALELNSPFNIDEKVWKIASETKQFYRDKNSGNQYRDRLGLEKVLKIYNKFIS
jgi:hypothetical protein